MIITLSGRPGSGKTTVGTMLATHFGYETYDIGIMRREIARRRGLTLAEYNTLGETDPTTDTDVDDFQRELGATKDNFIIQGRLGFHFIPHSVKIFLDCSRDASVARIWKDLQANPETRNEGKFKTPDELRANIEARDASDVARYAKYYNGLNHLEPTNYDLWLDTSTITPEETFQAILAFLDKKS